MAAKFCICFLYIKKEMDISLKLNINKNKRNYDLGRNTGIDRINSVYPGKAVSV
jgi:hypothetical protein